MPLTDLAIKRSVPGPKIIKLSDGGGLQLWITPDGAKRWRLAYRFRGAQKTFAIGVYPEVGLRDARDAREGARKTLAHGEDPTQVKQAAKAAKVEEGVNTFATIASELAEKKRRDKKAAATLRKFEWFMSFALPAFGSRAIGDITAREVLMVLKEVESRGIHETARKLRTAIGDVFRYAIATARAENDPTTALRGALVTPTVTSRAAIVAPNAFGGLLRASGDYQGAPETRAAPRITRPDFCASGRAARRGMGRIRRRRCALGNPPPQNEDAEAASGPFSGACVGYSQGTSTFDRPRDVSISLGTFGRALYVGEHVERGFASYGFQK